MPNQKDFKINLSGRGHNYTEEEIKTVVKAMRRADPLTQGCYQKRFERKFSEYISRENCFAVSSCTSALELAAVLCRLRPEDEVIIPAHTFCATAIPFARTGAKLVWADIDPDTRVISVKNILPLITRRTKVIVAVHLYGLMAQMPEIMKLAKNNNLLVVEDCAQSPGASINGVKAGCFGDFACFSFHTHKNISTLGEGGMLAVKDDDSARLVPGLRHNGIRPFTYKRKRYWEPAMSNVDFDIDNFWPYNFCIGEVQCALGIKLLDRLDTMNNQRNRRAKKIIGALMDYPELKFQSVPKGYCHSYYQLSALYDGSHSGKNRRDFMDLMAFNYRIKVIVQYYPLYRYPMFVKAGFGNADCPNADYFFDNMVSFPFHHWMNEKEVDYMVECTRKTLDCLRGGLTVCQSFP